VLAVFHTSVPNAKAQSMIAGNTVLHVVNSQLDQLYGDAFALIELGDKPCAPAKHLK
jgi:hypothetical protein